MTVVSFPERVTRDHGAWRPAELNRMVKSIGSYLPTGEVSGWSIGATEAGDPQLYVLGPAPEHDCILCVSRLGPLYVLEDGAGRVVVEQNSLMLLAEQMKKALRSQKIGIVARLALIWCAIRQTITEKIEPILGESEELLVHFGPQLAALA